MAPRYAPTLAGDGPLGGAPASAQTQPPSTLDISGHFGPDACVLLTGASGFIGSLVLEKLLRSTRARRVYVLLRARRGAAPAERLAAQLRASPLFHLVRGPAHAERAVAVAGDVLLPGLGLSPGDEARLLEQVDTVIHCAAGR